MPPAVVRRPPRSFHITLMCDPMTNVFGYHWYRGSNSLPNFTPTNGTFTENNWVIQSNLWPGVSYDFAVAAVGTNNVESDLSPLVHWPQPRTNFFSLGVSSNLQSSWSAKSTLVMDERLANFRLKRVSGGYELHSSPNFMPWVTVTNWPTSEPLPTFYLRGSNWDNVTGKAMPD